MHAIREKKAIQPLQPGNYFLNVEYYVDMYGIMYMTPLLQVCITGMYMKVWGL